MNLLEKIGSIILKGTQIILGFGATVQQQFPGTSGTVQVVSKDITDIANIIIQIEAFGQTLATPGADKLRAAAPLVAQIILQSSMMAGHTIADQTLYMGGATKIADGFADVLNSLHGNVDTTSKT